MASHFWAKLPHAILDDASMGLLPDRLWRRAVECELLASEQGDGGWLPPVGDMAWRLHVDLAELESELGELAVRAKLEMHEGRWFVVGFAERQAPASASERGRLFRERQREQGYRATRTVVERSSNDFRTSDEHIANDPFADESRGERDSDLSVADAAETAEAAEPEQADEQALRPVDEPFGVYQRLCELEPGIKRGPTLRDAKLLLNGDPARNLPAYSGDDIVTCAAFLQTDPWRIANLVPLSTQAVIERIGKWIGAGRPATWEEHQQRQQARASPNGRRPGDFLPVIPDIGPIAGTEW